MPPKAADPTKAAAPLFLITGDDDFAVKSRARQIFEKWKVEGGGFDHEMIDASAANGSEALAAVNKLREALQTLPFFGGCRVIWFQNCNFLAEERAATNAVNEALALLVEDLKAFKWDGARLLITSPKVDKRKSFYKTLDKLGTVETFAGWSIDDKNWIDDAEIAARQQIKQLGKEISPEALSALVANVGPNNRMLTTEVEKLCLYVGERARITIEDVDSIVTKNKQAKAFALADAVAARNLPRVLKTLDEELWMMNTDTQRNEIGMLYGVISKLRTTLLLKELMKEGFLRDGMDYNRFKAALEAIPPERLPDDRKFNPLAMHPYMLYHSLVYTKNYSSEELVRAMETLLIANQRLVTTNADTGGILREALMKIVATPAKQQEAV